jgi:lactosylceramide 4-alpha-galactosyltransferase
LGKENSKLLSACVLSFASEGIGHRVAEMCVNEILTDFRGDSWNHNGPDLVTKVFKEVCGVDEVSTTALAALTKEPTSSIKDYCMI